MKTLKGETYKDRLLNEFLRKPESIRDTCNTLYVHGRHGGLKFFDYDYFKLEPTADFVIDLIRKNYPDLNIPSHSRFRHFESNGVNRINLLLDKVDEKDRLKSLVELTIISVILDAGAGAKWRYIDHQSGKILSRSEGLAAASYNLFMSGIFSSSNENKYQVDANGLKNISEDIFRYGLQVAANNHLIGLHERVKILNHVGENISFPDQRLGSIVEEWQESLENNTISMRVIFVSLLDFFSGVLPQDVGPHSLVVSEFNTEGLVPFHKLIQWLCYSLIEPLEYTGIKVVDADILTGLPEYRNGGLFIDMDVLKIKNLDNYAIEHNINSELIVEWRAMTVILLDLIAEMIRDKLSLNKQQLPMTKILQGGTWYAGREIAYMKRKDGSPPLRFNSHGTLF